MTISKRKMRLLLPAWLCGAAVLAILFGAAAGNAGIFDSPVSSAEADGRAVILLPIAAIASEGVRLPVVLKYSPLSRQADGLFQGGWSLPLFETRIQQSDEQTFLLNDFQGYAVRFLRKRSDPLQLRGSGGWRARIDGKQIEAVAPDGWKIVFLQGRPTKLVSPDGSEFLYTENGRSLIARTTREIVASVDSRDGRVAGVNCGDSLVSFDFAKLPVFESASGQTVVSSLAEMPERVRVNGKELYHFLLEPGGDGTVRLDIGGSHGLPRAYAWDAGTGAIRMINQERVATDPLTGETTFDGPWGRRITSGMTAAVPYEIDESGARTSYYLFPKSTAAAGLRKVVRESGGVSTVVYERSIDECGRTLRERDLRSGTVETRIFQYDGEETRVERYFNAVLVGRELRTPEKTERTDLVQGTTVTLNKDTVEILWKK